MAMSCPLEACTRSRVITAMQVRTEGLWVAMEVACPGELLLLSLKPVGEMGPLAPVGRDGVGGAIFLCFRVECQGLYSSRSVSLVLKGLK